MLEENEQEVREKLQPRGEISELNDVFSLIKNRKIIIQQAQELQENRNKESKLLQQASSEEIDKKRLKLRRLSQQVKECELQVKEIESKIKNLLLLIPNIPRDDVPKGESEDDNLEVKRVLTPPSFSFEPKSHVDIGESLSILDFERAAKISGARFAFLQGIGSKLNRALMQFFLDFHIQHGDTELTPPYLVRKQAMIGTGQLPKFKDDAFLASAGQDNEYYLVPTAEVPLTNYYAGEILQEEKLPTRFCAYSACFRAEAGAAGKDTRGLIRMHQFEKVEMVRFCTPEQADEELDLMVQRSSDILEALGLHHRIVTLCIGDLSALSEKTYDLEVWLPSQNTFREISSCSVFGSYQARRAQIRYRPKSANTKQSKPRSLVTLNGSGLPLGRTLVAILENFQQADGSVIIPQVLWPYMGGIKKIEQPNS